MDAQFTVAQITGALFPSEALKIVRLIKPETDQALVVHLDRSSKLDLTAIGDEKVTFVHVSDSLVILFDNHSTVTVDPFYDSRGLPLANISVELSADRSVSGAEFASLFPITTDQSILPAAANTGSPPSGANFESATVDQFPNNPVPLALLGPDTQAGLGPNDTGIPTIHTPTVAVNVNPLVQGAIPSQGAILSVHDVGGNEDRPIALGITDVLSAADTGASLGNLTITGVPAGATLSAGIHNADGSWTLTPAQLTGLALTSDGEVQHFTLTVQATTIGGTTTDVSTASINVSITPVADAPTLTIGASGLSATVSGNEDQAIALPIKTALGEADADAVLSVTISGVPTGVTLSAGTHNADGSWTLTPAQLSGLTLTSDGEVQHFNLTVTATTVDGGDAATATSTSGSFTVNVTPVPETPDRNPGQHQRGINDCPQPGAAFRSRRGRQQHHCHIRPAERRDAQSRDIESEHRHLHAQPSRPCRADLDRAGRRHQADHLHRDGPRQRRWDRRGFGEPADHARGQSAPGNADARSDRNRGQHQRRDNDRRQPGAAFRGRR